jgi:diguanylate cyclase (GGDEF)-like protein
MRGIYMINKLSSLDELKRNTYLWIVPFIVLALIIYNLVLPTLSSHEQFYMYISRILIVWLVLSWIFLFRKRLLRFTELSNLVLISFSHLVTGYDVIYNYMIPGKEGALGITIMWTPLVFISFFLTLKSKLGLIYSLVIYGITLGVSLLNMGNISSEYVLPLSQFLVANLVYIIIFYFAQQMFSVYAELEIAKRSAYIDSLTGIANRHKIDIWLEEKVKESKKYNSPLSVIFFDIDHFKKVNDTYGHLNGDNVLREITSVVSENLPEGNLFGRWGGEEFIIISSLSPNHAFQLAEKLRKMIESHDFQIVGKLTSSFGVASYQLGDTVNTLLDRADVALYLSKSSGRNLCRVYSKVE